MKNKVQILIGISASGKSTYAKELVEIEGYFRLNRDDFRKSLITTTLKEYWNSSSEYRNVIEDLVTVMLNSALVKAIKLGLDVVIDNTHLQTRYVSDILKICKESCGVEGFEYFIKLFDASTEVCIERDKNRVDSVGEAVIRNQSEQRKKFKYAKCNQWADYDPYDFKPLPIDLTRKKACIIDIDGTVAKMQNRSPFDWKKVGSDSPNQPIINIIGSFISPHTVHYKDDYSNLDIHPIFVSGRSDICRTETVRWLKTHINLPSDVELYMRKDGDDRPDDIVKYEILRDKILPNYNPVAVFDDRKKVVDMWRKIGLTCLQVADGDF